MSRTGQANCRLIVFQPIYRPHAQEHIAPEPIFHDKRTKDIIREYIKLRYRLLPYNYTLAYQNSICGMPLMRPLFFEDELDLSLIDNKDSYCWGDAFLVSPVVDAGVKSMLVDLPDGVWFDYWTDKRYAGKQKVDIPITLETIPVLVRGGSFIPMVNNMTSTKYYSSRSLTLHYYADSSVLEAKGMMYEDDGATNKTIQNGEFELLQFYAQQINQTLRINLCRDEHGYSDMPEKRHMRIVIHNIQQAPQRVYVGNRAVDILVTNETNDLVNRVAYWNKNTSQLSIKFDWDHQSLLLGISLPSSQM